MREIYTQNKLLTDLLIILLTFCLSDGASGHMTEGQGHSRVEGHCKGDNVVSTCPKTSSHHKQKILDTPQTILDVDYDLLTSGIAILPGK